MPSLAEISRQPGGHVYVLEFSSGVIKVGLTGNPRQRLDQHAKTAKVHSIAIMRSWFSPRHTDFQGNETKLIDYCTQAFGPPVVGNETFKGDHFEPAKSFAESLDFQVYERPAPPKLDSGGNELLIYMRGPAALEELWRQAKLVIDLTNDGNRWDANEALFQILKQIAWWTPPPWRESDPDVSLRHLRTISRDPRNEEERAADFELSSRVLFLMSHRRWPDTFQEALDDVAATIGQAS